MQWCTWIQCNGLPLFKTGRNWPVRLASHRGASLAIWARYKHAHKQRRRSGRLDERKRREKPLIRIMLPGLRWRLTGDAIQWVEILESTNRDRSLPTSHCQSQSQNHWRHFAVKKWGSPHVPFFSVFAVYSLRLLSQST